MNGFLKLSRLGDELVVGTPCLMNFVIRLERARVDFIYAQAWWNLPRVVLSPVTIISRIQRHHFLALPPKTWWNGVILTVSFWVIRRLRYIFSRFQPISIKSDIALPSISNLNNISIHKICLELLMKSIRLLLTIHYILHLSLEVLFVLFVLTWAEIWQLIYNFWMILLIDLQSWLPVWMDISRVQLWRIVQLFLYVRWSNHRRKLIAPGDAHFLSRSNCFLNDMIDLLLLIPILLYHILQLLLLIILLYNYLIGVSIDNLSIVLGWSHSLRLVLVLDVIWLGNWHVVRDAWNSRTVVLLLLHGLGNIVNSWIELGRSCCPVMGLIVIHYYKAKYNFN